MQLLVRFFTVVASIGYFRVGFRGLIITVALILTYRNLTSSLRDARCTMGLIWIVASFHLNEFHVKCRIGFDTSGFQSVLKGSISNPNCFSETHFTLPPHSSSKLWNSKYNWFLSRKTFYFWQVRFL